MKLKVSNRQAFEFYRGIDLFDGLQTRLKFDLIRFDSIHSNPIGWSLTAKPQKALFKEARYLAKHHESIQIKTLVSRLLQQRRVEYDDAHDDQCAGRRYRCNANGERS